MLEMMNTADGIRTRVFRRHGCTSVMLQQTNEEYSRVSIEPQEYTDEQTGMRLTVERDAPYQDNPRVTAFLPENRTLSIEEGQDAIRRLFVIAGFTQPGQAPPQGGKL